MQIWSVGLREDLMNLAQHPTCDSFFRHFNNGVELITALREHAAGRLAILLKLHLPIIDGLGVIRLLQQEGMIDRHHFILSAPTLSVGDQQQLSEWQVQTVQPAQLMQVVSKTLSACG